MPVTAECTISTRAPQRGGRGRLCAMLRQLASEETLVPPNFRTIHAEGVRVTEDFLAARAAAGLGEAASLVS